MSRDVDEIAAEAALRFRQFDRRASPAAAICFQVDGLPTPFGRRGGRRKRLDGRLLRDPLLPPGPTIICCSSVSSKFMVSLTYREAFRSER